MRVLLPGLTLPVDDYARLVALLPGPTVVFDTLASPITATTDEIRATLDLPDGRHELIGHSVGALAALEWAARYPESVSRVVLLDPTDPYGEQVPAWMGGRAGRCIVAVVGALARSRRIARALGRRGRRSVLGLYGVVGDPLSPTRVDELFGTREALAVVAAQVTGMPAQVARVRALVDSGFTPPTILVIAAREGESADRRVIAELAARLATTVVETPGQHLFPMTHPEATATLLNSYTGNGHQRGI